MTEDRKTKTPGMTEATAKFEHQATQAASQGGAVMTEQTPDGAVTDLEGALTNLGTAREALGGFLEDSMQDHCRLETAYCILLTLDQAHHRAQAAWKILWEARPLEAGKRDKSPLKAVEGGEAQSLTRNPDIMERTIADLEGATQALNNFAQSAELTTETADGLHWLALQIDGIMVELRNRWDEMHPVTAERG